MNAVQQDLLLNAVQGDRELLGQFQGLHARPRIVQKWNDLAADLNKLGKTKSPLEWNKVL